MFEAEESMAVLSVGPRDTSCGPCQGPVLSVFIPPNSPCDSLTFLSASFVLDSRHMSSLPKTAGKRESLYVKEEERERQRGEKLSALTSLERKGGETPLPLLSPRSLPTILFCFILSGSSEVFCSISPVPTHLRR